MEDNEIKRAYQIVYEDLRHICNNEYSEFQVQETIYNKWKSGN